MKLLESAKKLDLSGNTCSNPAITSSSELSAGDLVCASIRSRNR